MKKVTSVRISEWLLKEAKRQDVNLSAILEVALNKAIKTKKCPLCGAIKKTK